MSVSLYTDEHVRYAVVAALRLREVDVLTAQEDGRAGVNDAALLSRSTELNRVMFSQDADLLAEACRRQREGIPFGGLVYGHQLRVSVGACINDLELLAKACSIEEFHSQVVYLPLR